jgi:hypothetical protein
MANGSPRPLRPDLSASFTDVGLVFGAGFLLVGAVRVLLVMPRLAAVGVFALIPALLR